MKKIKEFYFSDIKKPLPRIPYVLLQLPGPLPGIPCVLGQLPGMLLGTHIILLKLAPDSLKAAPEHGFPESGPESCGRMFHRLGNVRSHVFLVVQLAHRVDACDIARRGWLN